MKACMMIQDMNSNMLINKNLEINDDFHYTKIEDSNKDTSIFNQNKIILNPTIPRENTNVLIKDTSSGMMLKQSDTQNDINQYPILKLVNRVNTKNHWIKFGINLENLIMESD